MKCWRVILIKCKVTLLYGHFDWSCVIYCVSNKYLGFDESIVPHCLCQCCKIFIRGNTTQYESKIWCFCRVHGYPYKITIYDAGKQYKTTDPLGSWVVIEKLDLIIKHCDPLKCELYFNVIFQELHLLLDLPEKNAKASGTIKENTALGTSSRMKLVRKKRKSVRGVFDIRRDGLFYFRKWNSNSIVNIENNVIYICLYKFSNVVLKRKLMRRRPSLNSSENSSKFIYDLWQKISLVVNHKRHECFCYGSSVFTLCNCKKKHSPTSMHKKWCFPLSISLVNVNKSAENRNHTSAWVVL